MNIFLQRWRCIVITAWLLGLGACGQKEIPFTDYLVENLLRDNLSSLAEPPFFEVRAIEILKSEHQGNNASASVDVRLYFPEDFDTVVGMRKLEPFNIEYLQYKSSFGKFAAGEQQVHHARYDFQRRGGKWVITGSQALSAPDISAAE